MATWRIENGISVASSSSSMAWRINDVSVARHHGGGNNGNGALSA